MEGSSFQTIRRIFLRVKQTKHSLPVQSVITALRVTLVETAVVQLRSTPLWDPVKPETQSSFDTIYGINTNVGQLSGSYSITNMDIARSTGKSTGQCSSGICMWPKQPNGNVYIPYTKTIGYSRFDDVVFLATFQAFREATCIRFVPRFNETDYITFNSSNGCWSSIGRTGNQQFVSISRPLCVSTGVIAHELMHVLGFNHEHVRKDRDTYMSVQWKNILNDYESNFEITDTNNIKYSSYDYGSILHYGKTAYSKDGIAQTLIPIPDSSVNIGQTTAMSKTDIQKINLLYRCDRYIQLPTTAQTTSTRTPSPTLTTAKTTITTTTRTMKTTEEASTTTKKTTATSSATITTTPSPTSTTAKSTISTTARTVPTTAWMSITPKTTTTTITETPKTTTTSTTTPSTTTPVIPTTTYNAKACGRTLTARSGVITTPNYPDQYQPLSYCLWTITATRMVNITILDFDVESSIGCIFDYMKFDDLASIPAYTTKKCGHTAPNKWVSFRGSVQIIFVSDATVQMKGFKLQYTAGIIQDLERLILSLENLPKP
ncbi:astacin-like metalloendopeptidase [Ambystoma mexicanum]|uniref:astacin-like metalloendopeptidase n=1 Tax=Ambystoma mexicanum TaxID=8296 RepID=UPI0037E79EB2